MERRKKKRVYRIAAISCRIQQYLYNHPTPKSRSWLSQLLSHILRVCMLRITSTADLEGEDVTIYHPNSVTYYTFRHVPPSYFILLDSAQSGASVWNLARPPIPAQEQQRAQ